MTTPSQPVAAPLDPVRPAPAAAAVTELVCTTCRAADGLATVPTPGEDLLAAVRAAAGDAPVAVDGVACLANCDRRLSAALVADGGWTYVFGRLAAADAQALVAGAAMLAEAGGAQLPWRGRPDCLKRGLVARIPPLTPRAVP
jgi:predicted metal-binding protein